jgi:cytochrome P450
MVPEIIRWQTPLAHMRRTALEEWSWAARPSARATRSLMWYVSGNRDETPSTTPTFIIDRPMARASTCRFGFGIHRCVGNRLAELQLKILWEEILVPDVAASPERRRVMDSGCGVNTVPLTMFPSGRRRKYTTAFA